MNETDYRIAFDLAPIGLVISRNRLMVDCNQQLLDMFDASRAELVGQSFEVLYPTHAEFVIASCSRPGNSTDWWACSVLGREIKVHEQAARSGQMAPRDITRFATDIHGLGTEGSHPASKVILRRESVASC